LIARPDLLKKKSARYFLKQTGKEGYVLDEERIKQHEKYDGFLAISTNNTTLATVNVLEQYRQLFKIEHAFRTFKSHLETRPMFHWTDKRIEGHICLCYIAYSLQHWVWLKLKNLPMAITDSVLRQMLDKMQVSLLQHNDQKVYLRSMPHPHEAKLQQLIGIKPLPALLPRARLAEYL
jgi:transposase